MYILCIFTSRCIFFHFVISAMPLEKCRLECLVGGIVLYRKCFEEDFSMNQEKERMWLVSKSKAVRFKTVSIVNYFATATDSEQSEYTIPNVLLHEK